MHHIHRTCTHTHTHVRVHRSGRAGKRARAHGAFPMTIRPQRPPTESRPPRPIKATPVFHPCPIRPFETISSSGLINPTDGIGVRYQLKMMKPNGAPRARLTASGASDWSSRRCIARAKLIPPPCPFCRNKLKRLGIPRGCFETVLRLASDGGENKRERGVPLVRENWKKCAAEEEETQRKRGREHEREREKARVVKRSSVVTMKTEGDGRWRASE